MHYKGETAVARILIVDDAKFMRVTLSSILKKPTMKLWEKGKRKGCRGPIRKSEARSGDDGYYDARNERARGCPGN